MNQSKLNTKQNLDHKLKEYQMKKHLVPTNNDQHPSTLEYVKEMKSLKIHDISYPVAMRISSRLDKESVY